MRQTRLLTVLAALGVVAGAGADTLHVAADAQTSSAQPALRLGLLPAMAVRSGGGGPVFTSYLRFDLSVLPANPAVQKATLRLWVFGVVTPGTIEVVPVAAPWQESTITAATAPALATTIATFAVEGGDALHFVDVDVTGLVKDWASGFADNRGLALRGPESGAVYVVFDTKESIVTSHPPELEVALDGTGVPGPQGPQGPPGPQGPQGPPGSTSCSNNGDFLGCYQGPQGTMGVGACKAGSRTCANGAFGSCVGQVLPAPEATCDHVDENCNGLVDEGVGLNGCSTRYLDADHDGYGSTTAPGECRCATPGFAANNQDCLDSNATVSPGQGAYFETPRPVVGGFDYNCDGVEEKEFEGFGYCYYDPGFQSCVAVPGWYAGAACGEQDGIVVTCDAYTCNPVVEPATVKCR